MAVHVLGIGINDYAGTGSDLAKCVNDSVGFTKLFGAKPYLLNGAANRSNVLKSVQAFASVPGPGDWYIGHYSGHGSQIPDRNRDEGDRKDEVIVTADNRYVVDDEFLPLISLRNPQARFLQVFDSCFSGDMARSLFLPREELALPQARYLSSDKLVPVARGPVQNYHTSGYIPNVIVFSGCADFEYSYEGSTYGIFTGALIKTYRPTLTIGQWFMAACKVVASGPFGNRQHPQVNCHPSYLNWPVPRV